MASGIDKVLVIAKETTFGTASGDAGQVLRRRTSNINMEADQVENDEIVSHQQVLDVGQGGRRVAGNIEALLSGGTYQMIYEALLRRLATGVTTMTGLTLTTVATPPYTITRSAGSWITDGLRIGHIFRVTGGLNVASRNRNALVVDLTATVLTYIPMDGGAAFTAESGVSSCSVTVPGKYTYAPTSGHTDDSFTIEEQHTDIDQYYLSTGCKFNTASHNFQPGQAAQVTFSVMGREQTLDDASPTYASPTAATTSGMLIPIFGALVIDGALYSNVTSMTMDISGNMQGSAVVGSPLQPFITKGRVTVQGSLSVYLGDTIFADAFQNRTEMGLQIFFTEDGTANSNFVSMFLPRIKVTQATRDDGEKPIIQTVPYRALLMPTTTGYNNTTIQIQDSLFA